MERIRKCNNKLYFIRHLVFIIKERANDMTHNKLLELFRMIDNKKSSTKDHLTGNIMHNFSM